MVSCLTQVFYSAPEIRLTVCLDLGSYLWSVEASSKTMQEVERALNLQELDSHLAPA